MASEVYNGTSNIKICILESKIYLFKDFYAFSEADKMGLYNKKIPSLLFWMKLGECG